MARTHDRIGTDAAVAPSDKAAASVAAAGSRWGINLSIILGSLTSSVMMGSVNVSLPTMMTSLRAEVTDIQWVLTAFMISRTVVMPTLGWAGGWLGNRQLYLTSLSVFLAASMLCGLAWSLGSMIFFRVLQGLGAGYLFPLAMTILHETYPPGKRGTAMGLFMFGLSFGPAIGPTLGGYLVEHISWRAVFYINLPIGLVALTTAAATLPKGERRQGGELDLLGLVSMATFVVSLLLAVSQVRHYGWDSSYIITLLIIAGATLLIFVWAELTAEAPMVNLQIFTNLRFVLGAISTFFQSFTNFAMMFVVALFLQRALGYSPQLAGEIMLPGAIVWGLTSLGAGQLADRFDHRWLILAGSLGLTAVFASFAGITPWSGSLAIIVLLMLRSLSRGFVQSPLVTLIMATLPDQQVRLGAGIRGLLNSLGATFGVALAGFFLQERIGIRTLALLERQHLASVEHSDLVQALSWRLWQAGVNPVLHGVQTQTILNRWLVQEATITAYHDMFIRTAALVLLTAIPVLWVRQRRRQ
jgi:EmrB/QacA subfamily drug resistance transporter